MKSLTNARHVQSVLAALFVGGLGLNLIGLFVAYLRGAIYIDDVAGLVRNVLTVYSAPLGIILGAYFGAKDVELPVTRGAANVVALAVSAIWNALLLWRSTVFAFAAEDDTARYAAFMVDVSTGSMFLVAGALTFFFVKKQKAQP